MRTSSFRNLRTLVRVTLVLLAASAHRARAVTPTASFSVVQSFHQSIDGVEPDSELATDPSGNFYGASYRGGKGDVGVVYKVTPAGVESVFYDFANDAKGGTHPRAGLIYSTSDGNFYGTTSAGGDHAGGTFFELTPAGVLTTLYSFNPSSDGSLPVGTLVQGVDGNLYGVCKKDGGSSAGTLYKMTKSGGFTLLHSFGGFVGNNNVNDGKFPPAGLCKGLDNNFYGVTEQGGPNGNAGAVFSITPDGGAYTLLHSFNGTDGSFPSGALVQVSSGVFAGVTRDGGTGGGGGTIFEVGSNLSFAQLAALGSDLESPVGKLTKASDGRYYGIAALGGADGNGGVFATTPLGGEATVLSFPTASLSADGPFPTTGLTLGSDQLLHGVSDSGGANGQGFLFTATTGAVFNVVYNFFQGGNAQSQAPLVSDGFGNLFGTTTAGGKTNKGTIFGLLAGGKDVTSLHDFSGPDGATPSNGPLVVDSVGSLYGTTTQGGADNGGTVYKLPTSHTLATLHSFGSDIDFQTGVLRDGYVPLAGLTASGGNFFGLTSGGGANGDGEFFEITPTGAFTEFHSLLNSEGFSASASLVLGGDGNFYGTASSGGAPGAGTLYSITSGGTTTVLHSLSARDPNTETNADGAVPNASLIEGGNRLFFGVASQGGSFGLGTIYTITPGSAFNLLHTFGGGDGVDPRGLTKGSDGNFYGVTAGGGKPNAGTIFVMTPVGALTTLHSFAGPDVTGVFPDGIRPLAPLVETTPGVFFGTASTGGAGDAGTIFSVTISPAITSALSLTASAGLPFSYQITATNGPTAFAADNLPSGLFLNTTTGAISGTPPTTGTFTFKIGAQNAGGFDDETVTLTVKVPPPQITSALTASVKIGQPFSYQITATNSPSTFFALSLPPGLTLNATGVISGTPTAVGTSSIQLTAANAGGGGSATLVLTVAQLQQPTILLNSPPSDLTVFAGAHVPLAADVDDPDGVLQEVDFAIADTAIGTVTAEPFTTDFTAPAPGVYTLTAFARDTLGRISMSQRTLTTLASAFAPPVVNLVSGSVDGLKLPTSSLLTLNYSVTSNDPSAPITQVNFFANGAMFASLDANGNPIAGIAPDAVRLLRKDAASGTSNFQVTFTLPGASQFVNLVAVALDKLGRSQTSKPVTVQALATPAGQAPTVSVGLSDGGTVKLGKALAVPVTATDPGAAISKVDFFVNGVMQAEAAQAPFSFSFTPTAAGLFVLTAISTDANGLSAVSAPVRLEAAAPPGISVTVKGSPDASESGAKAKFLISRDSFLDEDLKVTLTFKGTAVNGVAYDRVPLKVIIPSGAASVKVKIKPIDNLLADGTRTVTCKLVASKKGDYEINKAAKKATVSILDND